MSFVMRNGGFTGRMKSLAVFLLGLLMSFGVLADPLIMCPNGRVKSGDTYEFVKSKCGSLYGLSSGTQSLDGVNLKYRTMKVKFKDGTKAAFVFINDRLLNVIVFD
ncbi:hypothetical protein DFP78_102288 [Photobacterium lutimaris]|nr:hypothetical protein DFP78_102288 [Photobacterium lutimaris]